MNNTIMLVDDEVNILHSLSRIFRREGYRILMAESGEAGLELLKSNAVAVVVSDHRMPGMDGVEFLQRVKDASPGTLRFMLTGYADLQSVVAAINKSEVCRYLTKPWDDESLRQTIKSAVERYNLVEENRRLTELTSLQNERLKELNSSLEAKVEEKTRKIRESFFTFVGLYADIIELHDSYLGGHSKRVAALSRDLAARSGLDGADVDMIWAAALLHNIGLVGVPREILEKDDRELTEDERKLLMNNPVLSQDLLSKMDTLRQVGLIIRSHTEAFDGSGYPDGLKREEIHFGSRIISICKEYDRLRHGLRPLPKIEALARIEAGRNRKFDPELVDAFLTYASDLNDERRSGGAQETMSIGLNNLRPDMVLARDLVTEKGKLLVTKGTVLTGALIEKVLNFNRIDPIVGPLLVFSHPA